MSKRNDPSRSLFSVERFQDYEGEERANLLRIASVGAFYIIHYLHFHKVKIGVLRLDQVDISERFHLLVTIFCACWALMSLGVLVCLRSFTLPSWVKFATTTGDLMLLTTILCIGNGPSSPIVAAYFLILCLAGLRFDLPLIRFATAGAVVGYLIVLAIARWPHWIGRDQLATVSRYEQIVISLALLITGVTLGQIIRRTRKLVFALTGQLAELSEEDSTSTAATDVGRQRDES